MKKSKPYMFVFNGKILEHDSLLELKTEVSPDEWSYLISETIDLYSQLKSISLAKTIQLDKNDKILMRSLARTLNFINDMDTTPIQSMIEHAISKYNDIIKDEIVNLETTIKISNNTTLDGNTDIIVSRIDNDKV